MQGWKVVSLNGDPINAHHEAEFRSGAACEITFACPQPSRKKVKWQGGEKQKLSSMFQEHSLDNFDDHPQKSFMVGPAGRRLISPEKHKKRFTINFGQSLNYGNEHYM